MQPIPFATQSYLDPSRPVSVQRLVNMYLQPKSEQAKSRTALHGTPGLKLWSTVGDGPCRGVIGMNGSLYIVSGGELYIVQQNGSSEYINDISGSGPVAMATNGTHVIITSNAEPSYAVNANSFQELEIPSFSDLTFQDGYILATERGTQRLFISSLDPGDGNPPSWDSLDFTLVNANPDLNVGIANLNRETWVFN